MIDILYRCAMHSWALFRRILDGLQLSSYIPEEIIMQLLSLWTFRCVDLIVSLAQPVCSHRLWIGPSDALAFNLHDCNFHDCKCIMQYNIVTCCKIHERHWKKVEIFTNFISICSRKYNPCQSLKAWKFYVLTLLPWNLASSFEAWS